MIEDNVNHKSTPNHYTNANAARTSNPIIEKMRRSFVVPRPRTASVNLHFKINKGEQPMVASPVVGAIEHRVYWTVC